MTILVLLSFSLVLTNAVAIRFFQPGPRGCAADWSCRATKACLVWPTCLLKPKTCGRSRGSRCSSLNASATASLEKSGWVCIFWNERRFGQLWGMLHNSWMWQTSVRGVNDLAVLNGIHLVWGKIFEKNLVFQEASRLTCSVKFFCDLTLV